MFKVGDKVFVKKSDGLKGTVVNAVLSNDMFEKGYLVKTELFERWYTEHEIELVPTISKTETAADYSIKSDKDKPQLHLVPISQLWEAVARVREYGVNKYGDSDSWKQVEIKRYHDALLRHTAAITQDLNGVDEESGLPHRWHIACNLAFIEYLLEE